MGGKKGLQISGFGAIFNVGEELELSLDTARGKYSQCLAGLLPSLESRDDIVEERGLEITIAVARLPQIACEVVSYMVWIGYGRQ